MDRLRKLSASEVAQFKAALRHYESKEYNQGLVAIDSVLAKHPDHSDSLALKGLMLRFLNQKKDAMDLVQKGLTIDKDSATCWHVLGILHRVDKNFKKALSSYEKAYGLDPKNIQLSKDLSIFYAFARDWKSFTRIRLELVSKIDSTNTLTLLGLANYFFNKPEIGIKVLNSRAELMIEHFNSKNQENSEFLLFYIQFLFEQNLYDTVLQVVERYEDYILDKTFLLEYKTASLIKLNRYKEAESSNYMLLDRNSDNIAYFIDFDQIHNLNRKGSILDINACIAKYNELAKRYPSSLLANTLIFEFCTDDQFSDLARPYIEKQIQNRISCIQQFFLDYNLTNVKKQYLLDIAQDICTSISDDIQKIWAYKFLSYMLDYFKQYEKASKIIDKALSINPECIEIIEFKARIMKHMGDKEKAAKLLDAARQLDSKDRGITSKTAKIFLLNKNPAEALSVMSLFTRNDAKNGAFGDIIDMQHCQYIYMDGLALQSKGYLPEALERFLYIAKIHKDWTDDQFDFIPHSFSIGTITSLIQLINWEDSHRNGFLNLEACKLGLDILLRILNDEKLRRGLQLQSNKLPNLERSVTMTNTSPDAEINDTNANAEIDKTKPKFGTLTNGKKVDDANSVANLEINRYDIYELISRNPLDILDIFLESLKGCELFDKDKEQYLNVYIKALLTKKDFILCKAVLQRLDPQDPRKSVYLSTLENALRQSLMQSKSKAT